MNNTSLEGIITVEQLIEFLQHADKHHTIEILTNFYPDLNSTVKIDDNNKRVYFYSHL